MSDALRHLLADVPLLAWLRAAAIGAATWVALIQGRRLAVRRLGAVVERTETLVDDIALAMLRRTRGWFLVLLALWAAAAAAPPLAALDRWPRHVLVLLTLLQAGLWLGTGWGTWLARALAARGASGQTALEAVAFAGRTATWLLLAIVGLENLGVNITALVTGLGIGGIAIALALQNVLGDLFASLSIVLDKPFEVGDAIQVDAFEGVVEHIGLKTTRVRGVDGEQQVFANADLLKARIRNLQRRHERRVVLVHTLDATATPDALAALGPAVRDAVAAIDGIRLDRAALRAATPEGLEFETVYWVAAADFPHHVAAREGVLLAVHRALRDLGVGLASADVTAARRLAARTNPR